MAVPVIHRVEPSVGPTAGGNIVRIAGDGFVPRVQVRFGDAPVRVVRAWVHAGLWTLDIDAPPHDAGAIDLRLENLDAVGVPIAGEITIARGAYEFERPQLVEESDLARLMRNLVRAVKREVLANVQVAVHVDHDDTPTDGLRVTTMATVPSIVLSGPSVRPSPAYRTSDPIDAPRTGGEVLRHRQRLTRDLAFTITGASRSTTELLSLFTAAGHFVARHPWISMLRDPARPEIGLVRWDVDPDGDWRTQIPGTDGVHAFTVSFVVRGFDLDEGLPRERVPRVEDVLVHAGEAPSLESPSGRRKPGA